MKHLAVIAATILLSSSQGIASVSIEQLSSNSFKVTKSDDNDPAVKAAYLDRRKFLHNGFETKRIPVFSYRSVPLSPAEWERRDAEWKSAKNVQFGYSSASGWCGSGGCNFPDPGTEGRPSKTTIERYQSGTELVNIKEKLKPNPGYNKLAKPSIFYSDSARNPGGYPFGIPKSFRMSDDNLRAYLEYLRK
jgi:hypothetical protein